MYSPSIISINTATQFHKYNYTIHTLNFQLFFNQHFQFLKGLFKNLNVV